MLNSYPYHQYGEVPTPTHEDFLKKTIEIKNKNIDELLQELKQTKDIYQEYKASYLNQQKKFKTKISQLSTQLSHHIAETQKLKQQNNKLKGQIQYQNDKEKKTIQTNFSKIKELTSNLQQSQSKYKTLSLQHQKLKQKYNILQDKYTKLDQINNNQKMEINIYENQMRKLREQFLMKQRHVMEENNRLKELIRFGQHKRVQKNKVNYKLDEIQNKIKLTLQKI